MPQIGGFQFDFGSQRFGVDALFADDGQAAARVKQRVKGGVELLLRGLTERRGEGIFRAERALQINQTLRGLRQKWAQSRIG